jgi:hypothetical protein
LRGRASGAGPLLQGDIVMAISYSDPFETLFALQRALDARHASDWMGSSTAGSGSFPPINIFQNGDDFVAVLELPGVDKNDFRIEAKENTIRIPAPRRSNTRTEPASTAASGSPAALTARYRCRSRSSQTTSAPNTVKACCS